MHERRHAYAATTLGDLLLVAERDALVGVYFPGHWYPPVVAGVGPLARESDDRTFTRAAGQLREYLDGSRREFDLPVTTSGDDFSERVWALLRAIPYGETTTYGTLAARLGNPRLAQRVGQAVGPTRSASSSPATGSSAPTARSPASRAGSPASAHLLALEEPREARAARLF